MDPALTNLCDACKAADTEKITERAKFCGQVVQLLDNASIRDALDNNSNAGRQGRQANWDTMFQFSKRIFSYNFEALRKVKDSNTTTSGNKKREATSVMKAAIKYGGAYIKSKDVIEFLIDVLLDETKTSLFAQELTVVVYKAILCYRQSWCQIDEKLCQKLLEQYCCALQRCTNGNDTSIDLLTVAKALHAIVSGMCRQFDLSIARLHKTITDFFKSTICSAVSIVVHEYVVSTVNILCQSAAVESRTQLCHLGEEIFNNLLVIWKKNPKDKLKDDLIEFFQLQMAAHHPMGATTDNELMRKHVFAVDADKWKSCLNKLYEALCSELTEFKNRGKLNAARDNSLKGNWLRLAADVCHQFTTGSEVLEVTQIGTQLGTQMTSYSAQGGTAKKRKIETGWSMLQQRISSHGNTSAVIPWLQLVTTIVERYPRSLTEHEHLSLMSCLQLLLVDCKNHDVAVRLLDSLLAMSKSFVVNCQLDNCGEFQVSHSQHLNNLSNIQWSEATVKSTISLLRKVSATAQRLVLVSHTQSSAVALLTYLVTNKIYSKQSRSNCSSSSSPNIYKGALADDVKLLWSLFLSNTLKPSTVSLQFLSACLRYTRLPERLSVHSSAASSSISGVGDIEEDVGRAKYSFRMQLLDWLLPLRPEDSEDFDEEQKRYNEPGNMDMICLTDVIVSLALRDPSSIISKIARSSNTSKYGSFESEPVYGSERNIEKSYLSEQFYCEPCAASQIFSRTQRVTHEDISTMTDVLSNSSTNGAQSVLYPVKEKVLTLLKKDLSYAVAHVKSNAFDAIERLSWTCSLALRIIQHANIYWQQPTLNDSNDGSLVALMDSLKDGFSIFSDALANVFDLPDTSRMSKLLSHIVQLFTIDAGKSKHIQCIVAVRSNLTLIRDVIPDKLLQVFLEKLADDKTKTSTDCTQRKFVRNKSNRSDDLDLEMSTLADEGLDEGEEDLMTNSSKSSQLSVGEILISNNNVDDNRLCESLLSGRDQVRLQILDFLCRWCSYEKEMSARSTLDFSDMWTRKLLQLIDEKSSWSPHKPFDLFVMYYLVCGLAVSTNGSKISDDTLECLLKALLKFYKQHRKEQDMSQLVLRLFIQLLPHLSTGKRACSGGDADNAVEISESLKYSREKAVCMIEFFWKLGYVDCICTKGTRLEIVKCLAVFIQIDPMGEWTSGSDTSEYNTLFKDHLLEALKDQHYTVREFVSTNIEILFATKGDGNQLVLSSRASQLQFFEKIYKNICELMGSNAAKFSDKDLKDMTKLKTVTVLETFYCVARLSIVCLKRAIYGMIQSMTDFSFTSEAVMIVLTRLSGALKYASLQEFMLAHLPYLIQLWLTNDNLMKDFPYKLLQYETFSDFFTAHQNTIVPFVFIAKGFAGINELCRVDDTSRIVLAKCLPQIMIHILPWCAASTSSVTSVSHDERERQKLAITCYDTLLAEVGKELMEESIAKNFEDILIGVLMALHETNRSSLNDDNQSAKTIRETQPEPNPPHFNTAVITVTLDYLTRNVSSQTALSLVSVLAKKPDSIQKVLLMLSVPLYSSPCLHEKWRSICVYKLFVHLVLKEFKSSLGGSSVFAMRSIIYALLHFLNQYLVITKASCENNLLVDCTTLAALDLLKSSVVVAIDCCQELLMKILPAIICTVVRLASLDGSSTIMAKSVELLNYLYLESGKEVLHMLARLNPLPDMAIFFSARAIYDKILSQNDKTLGLSCSILDNNIERFLSARKLSSDDFCTTSIEGLKQLKFTLCSQRQVLSNFLATNQGKDVISKRKDLLSVLIHDLVVLVRSTDTNEACLAAECLGLIGIHEDCLLTLQPNNEPRQKHAFNEVNGCESLTPDTASLQRNYHLLYMLDQYLTTSSIETVAASSSSLKQILSTKAGIQLINNWKTLLLDESLLSLLHPFKCPSARNATALPLKPSVKRFTLPIDYDLLWLPESNNHADWIQSLVCALISSGKIQDEILCLLAPVCQTSVDFSQLLLPYVIHNILLMSLGRDEVLKKILSKQIGKFFEQHCRRNASSFSLCHSFSATSSSPVVLPQMSNGSLQSRVICTNQQSVQVMLTVVHYLRRQQLNPSSTSWDNNFWLDLNYLHIALAALNCGQYFSAVLYLEIWCRHTLDINESPDLRDVSSCTNAAAGISAVELLAAQLSDKSEINFQDLMIEAYRQIGDPDAVYGCGTNRLVDSHTRVKLYEDEKNWSQAVGLYDLQLGAARGKRANDTVGILRCLNKAGYFHILDSYLLGLQNSSFDDEIDEMTEIEYEAACRSCKWDLDLPSTELQDTSIRYHQIMYSCLVGLDQCDSGLVLSGLKAAKLSLVNTIQTLRTQESTKALVPALARLQCVSDLQEVSIAVCNDRALNAVLERWQQLQNDSTDYDTIEPILTQRCSLLQIIHKQVDQVCKELSELTLNRLYSVHESLAKAARKAGRYQVAERVIAMLHQLSTTATHCTLPWRLKIEESKLYWARSEFTSAMYSLRQLLDCLIDRLGGGDGKAENDIAMLYQKCLVLYGNWLAETGSENPKIIIDQYLKKAVTELEKTEVDKSHEITVDAYFSLARYADTQYQSVVTYMKSADYDAKLGLIRKARTETERLKKCKETSSRYFRTLEKHRQIDEADTQRLLSDREQFLSYAIENYLKCLLHQDRHDLSVFRLTSLWFENTASTATNKLIARNGPGIKSHKFLPLMYQLAARMSNIIPESAVLYQTTLVQLVERVVIDHPHHCLFIILALANAKADTQQVSKPQTKTRTSTGSGRGGGSQEAEEEGRISTAKELIARLKNLPQRVAIVEDTEKLCLAYIHLANWNIDDYKGSTKPNPLRKDLEITRMKHLKNVAVITLETKVDPTCQYKDIVYVQEFEPTFTMAGGINLPKIISCLGSDGKSRRQLVKGKDDLRQDAVMQQVFCMVNNLLSRDSEARKRNLRIRTYKIVQLSQRSGLMEWCEGTIPLGSYLIGSTGAHQRYRPQDMRASDCRSLLMEAHAKGTDNAKYDAYMQLCRRFKPVMHHFFMEKFTSAAEWYERRLAYTRSVATTSIVGYILGIGDRHVQNILIDCQTAEVIHIDFGVAFEMGRILPTPETVPFRLSRDIVDGMGVAGVEGVFRRCCETTMTVMRESNESILTILQVLLYDPLCDWTISPGKAYQLQQQKMAADHDQTTDHNMNTTILDSEASSERSSSESVNKVAERALLRLQQKLNGFENNGQLSVRGQVNHLIQEARDPRNLCRLFPGWQAYL